MSAATDHIATVTAALRLLDPDRDWSADPIVLQAIILRDLAIRNARATAELDRQAIHTGSLDHLSAAVAALGDVMLEMERRRLLADPTMNDRSRSMLQAKALTDEQLGKLASEAFEADALELAKHGYPGAAVFSCSASDIGEGAG